MAYGYAPTSTTASSVTTSSYANPFVRYKTK